MNHEKGTIQSLETITEVATRRSGLNRRGFLGAAGAFSAAAFLAACGSDDKESDKKTTTTGGGDETTTTGGGGATTTTGGGAEPSPENDLKTAAFAASLEVLASSTYAKALDAAEAGDLGDVPPAVAEFVTVAQKQHLEHLEQWNMVLEGADMERVTEPPEELAASVTEEFGKVKDVGGAAKLALSLEQAAAATYLKAIPTLDGEAAIALASSIQIIDMQHIAVLLFALGEYPVPDTFAPTDKAVAPA